MGIFDKLTDRRSQEQAMKEQGRLPPGQSLTQKFPVLTYGPNPRFDPQTWNFRAFGEVEKESTWTWDEFLKLPTVEITTGPAAWS